MVKKFGYPGCIACKVFVCNKSLKCSIPVSKDFPGLNTFQQVALCTRCDSKEFEPDLTDDEVVIIGFHERKEKESKNDE